MLLLFPLPPTFVTRQPAYSRFYLLGFGRTAAGAFAPSFVRGWALATAYLLLWVLRLARPQPVALFLLGSGLLSQVPAKGQIHSLAISGGAAQGQYEEDVTRETSSSALFCGLCGSGTSIRRMGYYHTYALAGGGVAYNLRKRSAWGIETMGVGIWGGRERVGFRPLVPGSPFDSTPPPVSASVTLYDLNPYLEGRTKWWHFDLGYRAGLHVGQLRNSASSAADSSLRNTWLAPDARLWIGNRRVLFAQFDTGVGLLALGNHTSRFGLGTGLGADDGRYLLAGLAVATHQVSYNMGFVGANIQLVQSKLSLEPYAATDFDRHHQVNLRLHYQVPLSR